MDTQANISSNPPTTSSEQKLGWPETIMVWLFVLAFGALGLIVIGDLLTGFAR